MKIITLAEIDSTNEETKRLFLAGKVKDSLCIVAKTQTSGKGTQGRKWASPVGGLYMSVVHSAEDNALPMTTFFTLAAGVACVEAIKDTTHLDVLLKPINDLMVEGKKLGGILTETLIQNGQIRALITGVGLNIQSVSEELDIPVTSLQEELPPHLYERFFVDPLILALTHRIEYWHEKVRTQNMRAVETAWKTHQVPGSVMPLGC